MSDLTTTLPDDLKRIATETDVDLLLDEMNAAITGGVDLWIKAAAIWHRVKKIKPDSTIRCDLSRYLERLNIPGRPGPLIPELFAATYSTPTLLNRAMRYSFDEQQLLADDSPLPLYDKSGDHRLVAPSVMRRKEQKQVLGPTGIRGEGDQMAWMREQDELKASKEATDTDPPVVLSRKNKQLIVKGYAIGLKQLLQYAADLER